GSTVTLEACGGGNAGEAALIRDFAEKVKAADPDTLENYNLHGFDLPFLLRRAEILGLPLQLGRMPGLRAMAARRGWEGDQGKYKRFQVPGRELLDSLDYVIQSGIGHEIRSHHLKDVARRLGLADPERELIPGDQIYSVFQRDPDRVR